MSIYRDSNADAYRIARSLIHAKLGRHVWFLNSPDGVCNMPSQGGMGGVAKKMYVLKIEGELD